MVISVNLMAMNASRMVGTIDFSLSKNTEKLSSGYRINRSADDAAGLAISEKMRRQVRGLTQASRNAQDGVSFCQIADGALNEVHDILKRSEQLAVQAANATNSDEDRAKIQAEIDHLTSEIDRVHETTVFNEMSVFSNNGKIPQVNSEVPNRLRVGNFEIEVEWDFVDASGSKVNPTEVKESGRANVDSDMAKFVVQAAADAVYNLQQSYPSMFARAESQGVKVGLNLAKIDGPGGTLASAALSMSSSATSTVMSYTLNVDTSDYGVADFATMTDAQKADLAATIAHEMTHLVMYDNITDGMLGTLPKWFVEGMAQTSSGDNGWLSYSIGPSSTDAEITNYMSQLGSMPYGAGYLGVMTLGLAASGDPTNATSANIKTGLDKILTDLADKKSLDDAIKNNTSFKDTSDFMRNFRTGSSESLDMAKRIINARGTTGAGSLFGNLSDSESTLFAPATLTSVGTNYAVDRTNTRFSNAFGSGYSFPDPSQGMDDGGSGFELQVGSEAGQLVRVDQFDIRVQSIMGGEMMDVSTVDNASYTLNLIKDADKRIAHVRSYYGATQNRLEHTIKNLDNVVENTTSAESRIRDTDMAKEMVAFTNNNIIKQAGISMLTQANQSSQNVLSLLG